MMTQVPAPVTNGGDSGYADADAGALVPVERIGTLCDDLEGRHYVYRLAGVPAADDATDSQAYRLCVCALARVPESVARALRRVALVARFLGFFFVHVHASVCPATALPTET